MSVVGNFILMTLLCKYTVSADWKIKTKQKVRVSNIISVEKDISLLSCQIKCDIQKDCYEIGADANVNLGMVGDCYLLRKNEYSERTEISSAPSIVTKEMRVYKDHDLCKTSRCRNDQKCVVNGTRYTCVCKNGLKTEKNCCEYPLSCDLIKQSNSKTSSGFYTMNPSKPVSVYCDMDIDTNGWMLIANITLPRQISSTEAIKLSSIELLSDDIGQLNRVSTGRFRFNPVRLADFDTSFQYLHFYCKKPGGGTISITTLTKDVLDFYMLKTDSKPAACSSFKRLS